MKRCLILAALAVFSMPATAQDVAGCAKLQAQYESEFKVSLIKAIGTLDKNERCEIGRDAMTILDKLAAAADNCPVQAADATPDNATGQMSGLASMKLVRDGESVRDMVSRRKAAFERSCGK